MKHLSITIITLLLTLTASAQENKEIISTTSGLVSGIIQEGTLAYLGIPYAKVERFMPPQPVRKWKGVRKCDHWGPDDHATAEPSDVGRRDVRKLLRT